MAGVSECFSIGSTISCTTCFKQVIEGDVLAFDSSTKMLILKLAKSGKPLNDVFIINLGLCSDVQVKNESNAASKPPPSLNLQKLSSRVRNSVEQKKRWISAMTAGVSPDGQKLFLAISKTIDEVAWMGQSIVVFNDVIIKPPYKLENVTGHSDTRRLNYVKKIVDRLTKDRPAGNVPSNSNSHHSLALMQSQPLPQRRNSNGNSINQSQSTHPPMTQSKPVSNAANSNIKAN